MMYAQSLGRRCHPGSLVCQAHAFFVSPEPSAISRTLGPVTDFEAAHEQR